MRRRRNGATAAGGDGDRPRFFNWAKTWRSIRLTSAGTRQPKRLRKPPQSPSWWSFPVGSVVGIALAMFGLSAIGRGLVPGVALAGAMLLGTALLAAYVRHAARHFRQRFETLKVERAAVDLVSS